MMSSMRIEYQSAVRLSPDAQALAKGESRITPAVQVCAVSGCTLLLPRWKAVVTTTPPGCWFTGTP